MPPSPAEAAGPSPDEPTPLHLAAWATFAEAVHGYRAERATFGDPASPRALEALFFLDRRGRIRMLEGLPYVALAPRRPDATVEAMPGPALTAAADHMARRGLYFRAVLMPSLTDTRAWQWRGFLSHAAYTYLLPLDPGPRPARNVARKASSALAAGYTCRREASVDAALACFRATEERQGFEYPVRGDGLRELLRLLGPEHLRIYVAYAPGGEPASARAILQRPGAAAIDWMAGTAIEHIDSGATQLLIAHALDDLRDAGSPLFDFGGANLPSIAASKALWHGTLTPTFALQEPGPRSAYASFRRVVAR